MADHPTFEETYPKHAFSELVRLGIAIGRSILWTLRLVKAARVQNSSVPVDPIVAHSRPKPRPVGT
jgi:hypothetical protein